MAPGTLSETALQAASPKRGRRARQTGLVTSTARQKTITVTVQRLVRHRKYGKYIRRRTVLHAHDEKSECHKGDVVEIVQCRPLSKTKCWRLVQIVRRGAGAEGAQP
jgi:small subunit ribosomal protein S17